MLSEPTRKVAVFQLAKLRNDASATPKQQGPEGRTGPAGNDPYCLTLLSEPTNSKALKDGLPNVAFWTYKKSSRLRAFQAQKRRLRHAQTAGPWRTDRACRQRPLLPNVAFWTYKKSSHLPAFQAQKRRLRWRTDRACRQRPLLPNVAFWTYKKAIVELSKLRNGASATPKQQGPEGRTRPASNGPYCLTLLSEVANGLLAGRTYSHACPTCGTVVHSTLASGRIRVTHRNPSGRQCRTNQWRVHTWWSFQLKVATQHGNAPHCFLNLQEK